MGMYDNVQGLSGEDLNERSRNDPNFNPRDALWEQQKDMFRSRLGSEASALGWNDYDYAEMGDIERWVKDQANSGKDASPALEGAIGKIKSRYGTRPEKGSAPSSSNGNGGGTSSPNTTPTNTWLNTPAPQSVIPEWYRPMLERELALREAEQKQNEERSNALYDTLMTRINAGLNAGQDNPIIKSQVGAYKSRTTDAMRNYVSDLAEQGRGSLVNIEGQRRMAAERAGEAVGDFEAQAMVRELTAQRQEIAQSLALAAGMLSGDQQREAQAKLAMLDQAIAEAGIGLTGRSLDNNLFLGLGNLQLGARGQDLNYDMALRNLGFQDWDRNFFYDLVQRGLI